MMNKQHPLYQEDLKYILSTNGIEALVGKSFLITGATGLIGLCLIDALMLYNRQGAGITVYAVGRSMSKARERLGEYYGDTHFHFIEQDVRMPLPSSLQVDYMIPLASNTHPLAYSQYPIETIEINVKGAEHALDMAAESGATLLYPSTVEVYGNARGEDVFTEEYTGQLNLANARSCYTESKRLCEALCQSYASEKGAKVKIGRLCRVFGPSLIATDTKASSQFLQKALNHENIVLKSEGRQLFSYIYVADAVGALLHILIHGQYGQAYNISTPECDVRLRQFAQLCAQWCGQQVVFELPTETEKKGYSIALQAILDSSKLVGLGWKHGYNINNAIERTLNILSNQ